MPVLLSIFLIFVIITVVIRSRSRSHNKIHEEQVESFWARENESRFTRKKDISNLPYIHIPFEELPINNVKTKELAAFIDRITALSDKKILDLSNQSNTDLKLNYGVANLPVLIDCDTCYTELIKVLNQWAKCLYENGYSTDAKQVLEFAIRCNTSIAQSYILLGDIYKQQNEYHSLEELLLKCNDLNSPNKPAAISHIRSLLSTS